MENAFGVRDSEAGEEVGFSSWETGVRACGCDTLNWDMKPKGWTAATEIYRRADASGIEAKQWGFNSQNLT